MMLFDFYHSGGLEWLLEMGREALLLTVVTAVFSANRFFQFPGLRLMGVGLLLVCCEQVMHAASDIGHAWPREVPLTMSWIGWGTTAWGAWRFAFEAAALRGASLRKANQ